jgi:hypothetical protein
MSQIIKSAIVVENPLILNISKEAWSRLSPPRGYSKTSLWVENWILCGIMNGFVSIQDIQNALKNLEENEDGEES